MGFVTWLDFGSHDLGWLQFDIIAVPPSCIKKASDLACDGFRFLPTDTTACTAVSISLAERAVGVSSEELSFSRPFLLKPCLAALTVLRQVRPALRFTIRPTSTDVTNLSAKCVPARLNLATTWGNVGDGEL